MCEPLILTGYSNEERAQVQKLEQQINVDFATIKSDFAHIATIQPIDLATNKYYEQILQSNPRDQNNSNVESHQNGIDMLKQIYGKNMQELNELNLNPIQNHRLVNKIQEDTCFILLNFRYFEKIAIIFSKCIGDKLTVPMITNDDELGLIMTPKELNQVIPDLTNDYSSYLLALLRLVDTIVDYTSEVIIKISISQSEKLQYSLAVINSQVISKLQQGFQLLDLKNDNLRRKYDGLKYQVKKINSMVYDLSLRQLIMVDAEVI